MPHIIYSVYFTVIIYHNQLNQPVFLGGSGVTSPKLLSMRESELRYTLLLERQIVAATSRAASIRLSVMKAGFSRIALPINSAAGKCLCFYV